jgi:hypothetical protein
MRAFRTSLKAKGNRRGISSMVLSVAPTEVRKASPKAGPRAAYQSAASRNSLSPRLQVTSAASSAALISITQDIAPRSALGTLPGESFAPTLKLRKLFGRQLDVFFRETIPKFLGELDAFARAKASDVERGHCNNLCSAKERRNLQGADALRMLRVRPLLVRWSRPRPMVSSKERRS